MINLILYGIIYFSHDVISKYACRIRRYLLSRRKDRITGLFVRLEIPATIDIKLKEITLDLNWLEDYICLAEIRNFTRAADARNITQSAFSRRIQALESWLDIQLIDRSFCPIKITTAGQDFLPQAKELVSNLYSARDKIRIKQSGSCSEATFAVPYSLSLNFLPPHIQMLEKKCQTQHTQIVSDNLDACVRHLNERNCDYLICYNHPSIPVSIDERQFSRLDLSSDKLIPLTIPDLTGSPKWRLPGTPRETVPLVSYVNNSYLGKVITKFLNTKNCCYTIKHLDSLSEALKVLILQGHGVGWIPLNSAKHILDSGQLVRAGGPEWEIELSISIYAPQETQKNRINLIWNYFQTISKNGDYAVQTAY